jgi:hypothetical protein
MNFCRNTITRSGDAFMMLSGSIAFIPRINRKEKALITEMFVELLVRNARLICCCWTHRKLKRYATLGTAGAGISTARY